MTERIPCAKCGAMILPATAEATGGLCMPCKQGFRESLEESKRWREEQEKYKPTPLEEAQDKHWQWLVHLVHGTPSGWNRLSRANQLYFAASLVSGEVYNGGFDQYFYNTSGDYYLDSVEGLTAIGAIRHLRLLEQAKECIFGNARVPKDRLERTTLLLERVTEGSPADQRLNDLDKEFFAESLNPIGDLLTQYGEKNHLFNDFEPPNAKR